MICGLDKGAPATAARFARGQSLIRHSYVQALIIHVQDVIVLGAARVLDVILERVRRQRPTYDTAETPAAVAAPKRKVRARADADTMSAKILQLTTRP